MARKKKAQPTSAGRVKLRRKQLANGESLYLDTYYQGKRSYEFLELYLTGDKYNDSLTLQIAETKRSQREVELAVGGTGIIPPHIKHASFLDYFAELAEKKEHPAWKGAERHLLAYTGGVLRFGAITPAWVEGFREYLLTESGLSQNSCALYWQKLRAALHRAIVDKKLAVDPSANIEQIKMRSTERSHLSIEQVRKLANTPCKNEDVKRAFLFACFTGLRKSDLYNLTWEQVHGGNSITFRTQKTGKVETFPLNETAVSIIGELKSTGKVFNLLPQRTADNILTRWAATAAIGTAITWHMARHTYAMLLLGSGSNLYEVSKLLGHSDVKTTTVYARMLDDQKRRSVDNLPTL